MPENYLRDRTSLILNNISHVIKDFKELLRDEDADRGIDPVDNSDENQEDLQQLDELASDQEVLQSRNMPEATSSSFTSPTTSSTSTLAQSEVLSCWVTTRTRTSLSRPSSA